MKKLIITVLVCALAIVLFAVPAFADSGWSTMNNCYFDNYLYVSEGSIGEFTYRLRDTDSGSDYAYDLSGTGQSTVVALARSGSTFLLNVSAGDNVVISPDGDLSGWFGGSQNKLNSYCWALIQFNSETNNSLPYKVLYQSSFYSVVVTEETDGGIYYRIPKRTINFTARQDYTDVFVAIIFDVDLVTGNVFSMNRITYDVSWGNPNSPMAPNYTAPDSGAFDDYYSAEDDLLNDISGGLTDFKTNATDFASSLSSLDNAFSAVRYIFGDFLNMHDIQMLVLSLLQIGIVGYFLNIGGTIIKAFSRK